MELEEVLKGEKEGFFVHGPDKEKGKEFFNRLAGPKPKSMERLNEEELRRVTQLLSPQIRNEIRVSRLSR